MASEETSIFVASGKFTVEAEVWHSQFVLKVPNEKLPNSAQIAGRFSLRMNLERN